MFDTAEIDVVSQNLQHTLDKSVADAKRDHGNIEEMTGTTEIPISGVFVFHNP